MGRSKGKRKKKKKYFFLNNRNYKKKMSRVQKSNGGYFESINDSYKPQMISNQTVEYYKTTKTTPSSTTTSSLVTKRSPASSLLPPGPTALSWPEPAFKVRIIEDKCGDCAPGYYQGEKEGKELMCPSKSSCPKCQEKPPYYDQIETSLKFLFKHLGIILGVGLAAWVIMVAVSFVTKLFGRQFGGLSFFVPPPLSKKVGFISLHNFTVASAKRLETSVQKIVDKFLADVGSINDQAKKDVAVTNFRIKALEMIKPGIMPSWDLSFGKDPITPQLDAAKAVITSRVA